MCRPAVRAWRGAYFSLHGAGVESPLDFGEDSLRKAHLLRLSAALCPRPPCRPRRWRGASRTARSGQGHLPAAPNLRSSVPETLLGEGLAEVSGGGRCPGTRPHLLLRGLIRSSPDSSRSGQSQDPVRELAEHQAQRWARFQSEPQPWEEVEVKPPAQPRTASPGDVLLRLSPEAARARRWQSALPCPVQEPSSLCTYVLLANDI